MLCMHARSLIRWRTNLPTKENEKGSVFPRVGWFDCPEGFRGIPPTPSPDSPDFLASHNSSRLGSLTKPTKSPRVSVTLHNISLCVSSPAPSMPWMFRFPCGALRSLHHHPSKVFT
jgi:hypothetical protein